MEIQIKDKVLLWPGFLDEKNASFVLKKESYDIEGIQKEWHFYWEDKNILLFISHIPCNYPGFGIDFISDENELNKHFTNIEKMVNEECWEIERGQIPEKFSHLCNFWDPVDDNDEGDDIIYNSDDTGY